MITRIKIDGFKSFQNFEVELAPFTLVAGANGSGKSNLLDALRLLSRLVQMPVAEALGGQRGGGAELFTVYGDGQRATEMSFEVDVLLDSNNGKEEVPYRRVTYRVVLQERNNDHGFSEVLLAHEWLGIIPRSSDTWMQHYFKGIWNKDNSSKAILWPGESGVRISDRDAHLAQLFFSSDSLRTTVLFSEKSGKSMHVRAICDVFLNISVFDFYPNRLKQFNDRQGDIRLQEDGHRLAATLYRIQQTDPEAFRYIQSDIRALLPEYRKLEVLYSDLTEQYIMRLVNAKGQTFTSRVFSDGTLRMIALVALAHDATAKGISALEELENGVHPLLLKKVLELVQLMATDFEEDEANEPLRQVIVNTHSPTLLSEALKQNIKVLYAHLVTLVDGENDRTTSVTNMYEVINSDGRLKHPTKEKKGYIYANEVMNYLTSVQPLS